MKTVTHGQRAQSDKSSELYVESLLYRRKGTVRAAVADEEGFEPGVSNANIPAEGMEKWIIKAERAFNELATVGAFILFLLSFLVLRG